MATHIRYFRRLLVLLALPVFGVAHADGCSTAASIIRGPFNYTADRVEYSEVSITTSDRVVVNSGVSLIFSAQTIRLMPGFSALAGSTFRVLPGPVDCANPNLIAGVAKDDKGNPLDAIPVCLSDSSNSGTCARLSVTDPTGGYLFTDVLQNLPYRVAVDVSNAANPLPNYVWSPAEHRVVVNADSGNTENLDFTGTFNFSNFQKQVELTYDDFPKLRGYDLPNDYVFLKVYYPEATTSQENLIYLGQVTSSAGLLIEASVPLATATIYYETYSLDSPTPQTGTIRL